MSLENLCSRHSITVHHRSRTTGAAGTGAWTYPTTTSATCFLQPSSANERVLGMQKGNEISHTLYFSSDPSIANGDKITYGSRVLKAQADTINPDEADRFWKVYALEQEQRQ